MQRVECAGFKGARIILGSSAKARRLDLYKRNLVGASVVALLCVGGPAFAQFEGLDLSDDKPKKDDKKPAGGDEPGLDLSGPATPATPTSSSKPAAEARAVTKKQDDGPAVERDITQEDRVKSVQKKLYLKRGRFEVAPSVNYAVNDPYYTRFGGQLRVAWYPADTLAIAARGSLLQTLPTDDVRVAKRNLQSRIYFSVPSWDAALDIEWSPLYGKVAFLNSILHFDGYLIAGAAAVDTSTKRMGIVPGFDFGAGMRFVAKDWLAVNVALLNTTYTDVPTGTTKASMQNMMMLNAGVSFFFPLKSTFREAE